MNLKDLKDEFAILKGLSCFSQIEDDHLQSELWDEWTNFLISKCNTKNICLVWVQIPLELDYYAYGQMIRNRYKIEGVFCFFTASKVKEIKITALSNRIPPKTLTEIKRFVYQSELRIKENRKAVIDEIEKLNNEGKMSVSLALAMFSKVL